jgi:hypothetical protein
MDTPTRWRLAGIALRNGRSFIDISDKRRWYFGRIVEDVIDIRKIQRNMRKFGRMSSNARTTHYRYPRRETRS